MQEITSDKRQVILDKSEILFSEKGFDGTSIREIADEADVNVAMISYYFGSKENLLKSIIERHSFAILELVERETITAAGAKEKIRNILESYISYSFKHPTPIVIARRELGVNSRPILQDIIHDTYKKVKEILVGIIEEGQKAGDFRKFDIPLFMFVIGGIVDTMISELHTMELMGLDPSNYGLSNSMDKSFQKRFNQFYWDLINTYMSNN